MFSATITVILPTYALDGGMTIMIKRWRNKEIRDAIKEEISENKKDGENWIRYAGWHNILIGKCQARKEFE